MSWVIDTCLLIDIADADPQFASASATLIDAKRTYETSITEGRATCASLHALVQLWHSPRL
jgi:hypothetical protein